MWAWARARRDIDDARQRADNAELQAVEAELKIVAAGDGHRAAEIQAVQSRASTNSLRRQVDRNGFTEMLQQSFGRRGTT